MRAWLEQLGPPGPDILLPDDSGTLTFGRANSVTRVFDGQHVSNRHLELTFSEGLWRVRDLGSAHGTFINGERLDMRRALFAGDELKFGEVHLRFCTDEVELLPELVTALQRRPDDEMLWRVYADRLLEHGDPLGERIAKALAGQRVDHLPWLGALWNRFVSGELEVEWRYGVMHRATLRAVAGRVPVNTSLSQLFNLRAARFLQGLTIDVPRLHTLASFDAQSLLPMQRALAAQPSLPPTLRELYLGYELSDEPATITASGELALRLPALTGATVYEKLDALHLAVVAFENGVRLDGINERRPIVGGLRLRRGEKKTLFVEAMPGIPLDASGNPCHFSIVDGRARLLAGKLRGEVRVNQRVDSAWDLIPGDVIDVQGAAQFRVERPPP